MATETEIRGLNPTLMSLALQRLYREKAAADPSVMGGAPPGGMPGMMPGMPPPTDPSMGMAGGVAAAPPPPMPGAAPAAPGGAPAAPPKLKAEDMLRAMDYRLYNLQQQLTAIMNQLGVKLDPGALVTPPGSFISPQAELAAPGGPQDPTQGQAQPSAIQPIQPIQGAAPDPSVKQGAEVIGEGYLPTVDTPPPSQAAALAHLLRSRQQHAA